MAYIIPSKKIYEINNSKVKKNSFNSVESFFNNTTIDFGVKHTESKSYNMNSPDYDAETPYTSGQRSTSLIVRAEKYSALCQTLCLVTTNSYGDQEIEVDDNFDLSTENTFRDIEAKNRIVTRTIEKGTIPCKNNKISTGEFSSESTINENSNTYNYEYPQVTEDKITGLVTTTQKVGFKISETTIDGQHYISINFDCVCVVSTVNKEPVVAKEQGNYYNFLECQAVDRGIEGQKITFRAPIIKGFVLYIICDSIKDTAEKQDLACYRLTFKSESLDVHYTIGGNKITFDEKPVKSGKSGGLSFKINSNELSQDYNQRLELCNIVQDQYKNGKETAIIKCSVGGTVFNNNITLSRDRYSLQGGEWNNPNIEDDTSNNRLIYHTPEKKKVTKISITLLNSNIKFTTETTSNGDIYIYPINEEIGWILDLNIYYEFVGTVANAFDEVIPMIPKPVIQEDQEDGLHPMSYIDVPLATYSDGNPKEFIVVGVKTIYDGAIWQELTLQEKAQENI